VKNLADEQLMAQIQEGETGALDELYRRYAKRLYVFCDNLTRGKTPQDPEDLVQEVFLRVIKSAHTFNPGKASFRTWLYRVARNRCLDVLRREKILKFFRLGDAGENGEAGEAIPGEEVLPDPGEPVEQTVMKAALFEAIRDCIAELEKEEQKQALLLYYLGGKVYREIAEVLGKSTSTAKNWVESARDKVKLCLELKGFDGFV
jgi:RNA polymerase sigma-70 factor (ECF subfamily)